MALYFLWWPVWCQMSMRNTTKQLAMSTGKINADKTWESNMVKAPVGRPRFLRYLYVTLILFSIHIPLFTVFWYMPSSNASRGSVKSAVGAPHFFKILYLAIAKTSFLTKHFFRKLHLMPIRVLLSSFFHFLLVFYWLFPVTQGVIHFGHQNS